MLFSYNWLKEYAEKLPSPKEAAERLTMSGTEVEGITELAGACAGVVTAEVVSVGKHPNADRLTFCEVKTDKEVCGIVCGATNMKAGDKVALALPGASLPGGLKIKKSKIRGVESGGMMCSEAELGLKKTVEGIMILPKDTPLGADITQILGLKDWMLDVAVTPNRSDLLSVKGLARELGAITGAGFKEKETSLEETPESVKFKASVKIEENAPCSRYAARVIEGVKVGPSPDFIIRRLEAHGVRAINNVVDVTNYVMIELGQPLHAFDLDKVKGRTIRVRLSQKGEAIETIDNKVRTLDAGMLVIADEAVPIAVAGVMGGKATEVSESTRNILLESAWFDPGSVRRTSRRLALSSDSSYRFERGVDIEGVVRALDMAAGMIKSLAGGAIAGGALDIYPKRFAPAVIEFRINRAGNLLGLPLRKADVTEMFGHLGIGVTEASDGALKAVPPSYRADLVGEADLVEEVARLIGYDKIPTTLPAAALSTGERGSRTEIKERINGILTNAGFFEVINYSFVSSDAFSLTALEGKEGVRILNPLSEEQVVLRESLLPSLLENLRQNLLRKNEEVRIFEIAPVFVSDGRTEELSGRNIRLPCERWKISALMYGKRFTEAWNSPTEELDFYDVKGAVETLFDGIGLGLPLDLNNDIDSYSRGVFHPGKSARVTLNGKDAGVFGEVNPGIIHKFDLKRPAYLFELDVDFLMESASAAKRYLSLPRFPESTRDIAFIVNEEIPYREILDTIVGLDTKLIEKVELFDVYCGSNIPKGKRSMALRIVYRSVERTLKQSEVDEAHSKVASILTTKFGAAIRGETHIV